MSCRKSGGRIRHGGFERLQERERLRCGFHGVHAAPRLTRLPHEQRHDQPTRPTVGERRVIAPVFFAPRNAHRTKLHEASIEAGWTTCIAEAEPHHANQRTLENFPIPPSRKIGWNSWLLRMGSTSAADVRAALQGLRNRNI